MDVKSVMLGSFDRARDYTLRSVEALGDTEYLWRPGPVANPIAWLLLHISRAEDNSFARWIENGAATMWSTMGLDRQTGLPVDDPAFSVGGGWPSEQVGAFPYPPLAQMLDYLAGIRERSLGVIRRMEDARLDAPLRPDRPGTIGAYLYGAPQHESSHRGVIEYIRGLYAAGGGR
ncbi:MAG: DinB family protein [Dehalococcoidia bacterium]|nr:DinB family protein [Dehalococcoidia bacterium]